VSISSDTKTLYKAPPVPHKTEVIPIHTSDRAQFKFCRRKWNWASPMRENLRGKVTQTGITMPLWFGTGIHRALAQHYNPVLSHDPVEAFNTWYITCWEGGVALEEDLDDVCYDPDPYDMDDGTWRFLGLRDLLPDIYSHEEFDEHWQLGKNMMAFYRDEFAPAKDDFRVIVQEHQFSVPLGFSAIDPRDGIEKEVHYRGRQDAIIQDIATDRYGILEHKTAASVTDDYFRKLEKDEQVTSYMWSAEREAEIFDLPYKQIDFTLYNVMRKTFPKPPTVLKSGLFSVNRTEESTTWPMLEAFIKDAGIQVVVDSTEKLSNYVDYVKESGYDQFAQRKFVTRNRSEVKSCEWRVISEAEDMLGIPLGYNRKLYPNPTGDRYCLGCPFRAPCIAYDDGSDYEQMLTDNYEKNIGR
jgi:hypothetical protein